MLRRSALKKHGRKFAFLRDYKSLSEILADHKLASLGDTCVNFAYALALSNRTGKPSGAKVRGSALAEAFRKAGLRDRLPARMTRHMLADAAESLIVYAWLHNYVTLEEIVAVLEKTDEPIEGFSQLLTTINDRIKLS